MIGMSSIIGLNGAFETLAAQARGADRPDLIGVYLNRGKFLILIAYFFIYLMLSQIGWILIYIGQDSEVSMISQQYVMAYFPALVLTGFVNIEGSFMNLMGF
jgi:Na+-driven multidrug efflux pump